MSESNQTQNHIERDALGRIMPGTRLNPTGKGDKAETARVYRWRRTLAAAMREAVSPEVATKIINKLVAMALEGDKQAIQMVIKYVGLDTMDHRDFSMVLPDIRKNADLNAMLMALINQMAKNRIAPESASQILSALRLAMSEGTANDIQEHLDAVVKMVESRKGR